MNFDMDRINAQDGVKESILLQIDRKIKEVINIGVDDTSFIAQWMYELAVEQNCTYQELVQQFQAPLGSEEQAQRMSEYLVSSNTFDQFKAYKQDSAITVDQTKQVEDSFDLGGDFNEKPVTPQQAQINQNDSKREQKQNEKHQQNQQNLGKKKIIQLDRNNNESENNKIDLKPRNYQGTENNDKNQSGGKEIFDRLRKRPMGGISGNPIDQTNKNEPSGPGKRGDNLNFSLNDIINNDKVTKRQKLNDKFEQGRHQQQMQKQINNQVPAEQRIIKPSQYQHQQQQQELQINKNYKVIERKRDSKPPQINEYQNKQAFKAKNVSTEIPGAQGQISSDADRQKRMMRFNKSGGNEMIQGNQINNQPEKQTFEQKKIVLDKKFPTVAPGQIAADGSKKKIKCRFFPNCTKSAEECPYIHPTESCTYFPNCTKGDSCIYLHPEIDCKFGTSCTRPNCNYKHPKGRMSMPAKLPGGGAMGAQNMQMQMMQTMMMMMASKGMHQKPFNPSRAPYVPGSKPRYPNSNYSAAQTQNVSQIAEQASTNVSVQNKQITQQTIVQQQNQ